MLGIEESAVVQGREVTGADLAQIRELIRAHPDWSRRRLSEVLAREWDWRNAAGRLKDMATRSLLVKLDERGWIQLPARRRAATNRMRARVIARRLWDTTPLQATLAELGRLELREVSGDREGRETLAAALAEFHYLGHTGTVGENAQYLVTKETGCVVAGVVFGSAAWKCRDHDQFIGWSAEVRARNLSLVTNNQRFLMMPWVRVPHLGSWILGRVLQRLSADWQAKYGHPIALVETFVERERFRGTVYRAANWQHVGATEGRTRQDRYSTLRAPVKDIYVYPLARHFREVLAHGLP